MDFALDTRSQHHLLLAAFSGGIGGTPVEELRLPGRFGGFTFPEGVVSFSGAVFDTVALTSDAIDFAIDKVDEFGPRTIHHASSRLWFDWAGRIREEEVL
jgi:hypothetical protein